MRKLFLTILTSLLSLSLIYLFVRSNPVAIQEGGVLQEEYVPNEVLVKFKKDIDKYFIREAINMVQGKVITYLGKEIRVYQWKPDISSHRSFRLDPDLLHIKVPETIGTEQAIYLLSLDSNIEYVEKNIIYQFDNIPNDQHFNKLWGLHNTGQSGGKVDADIDAPKAWNFFTGNSNIVVAVIDSGVDYNHQDLVANIWTNADEIPGNGIDDDNNGWTDDVHGYDFANDDSDPMDDDYPYHGTHIAGTIGAKGNNEIGVVGINWNVKIMVLKAGNIRGPSNSAAIHAIDYATENGAHLSNNSWGISSYSQPLYDAIARAENAGKLFIAAAGNSPSGNDNDQNPHYPASYNLYNIISVAATDQWDNKAGYSHYGKTTVDLGAPGGSNTGSVEDIYSTKRDNGYQYMAGTSMAAPHVAGAAALIWGYRPLYSWSNVKDRIMNNVDYLPSLYNKTVTNGRLNVFNALPPAPGEPVAPSDLTTSPDCFKIKLNWEDNSTNEQGFKIERKEIGGSYSQIAVVGENVTEYWNYGLPPFAFYYYRVRAYNANGNSDYSNTALGWTKPWKLCRGYPLSFTLTTDKQIINSGESVTYTYEVKNVGEVDLTEVEITDEIFGKIVTNFTLIKGKARTFTRTVALTETTINLAEATAIYHYENKTKIIKSHANAIVEARK